MYLIPFFTRYRKRVAVHGIVEGNKHRRPDPKKLWHFRACFFDKRRMLFYAKECKVLMVQPMGCHFKGRIVCRLVPDKLDKRCITSKVVADYTDHEAGIFSIKDVNDFHLRLPEKIVLYVVEPESDATAD
jgi:hypothetical protein